MNKEKYLAELEELLTKNKVNNLYSIIRDYSNKIDVMVANGYTFDEIIDDLGTPREIANNYVKDFDDQYLDTNEKKFKAAEKEFEKIEAEFEKMEKEFEKEFDNDPDEVFEKDDMTDSDQFKKSRFEKSDRQKNKEMYDEQFEYNPRFQRQEYENKQYDNRFKQSGFNNPDLIRNILYIIIVLMVIALVFRTLRYFFVGGMMGYGITNSIWGSGIFGLFSIIPTIIIIIIVVYILRKNNKK